MSVETYEKGQMAALEKVASAIDSGYSPQQLWQEIGQVLGAPLEKNASQNDIDGRVGIEEVLYSFMSKSASYYGTHNVNDEYAALCDVFEKVANDVPRPTRLEQAGQDHIQAMAEGGQETANALYEARRQAEGGGPQGLDRPGAIRKGYESGKKNLRRAGRWAGNNKLQAAGAGVAGAGALGGLTYLGYNALTDDDEEEQAKAAIQRKTASYGEGDIDTAIAILEDAGYLEA